MGERLKMERFADTSNEQMLKLHQQAVKEITSLKKSKVYENVEIRLRVDGSQDNPERYLNVELAWFHQNNNAFVTLYGFYQPDDNQKRLKKALDCIRNKNFSLFEKIEIGG